MPSIAQQDYLRPSGKSVYDCHLFAALAHNIQQGTVFDTVFEMINGDGDTEIDRVLSYTPYTTEKNIYYCDTVDVGIKSFTLEHTQTQYEGLAAIQDAAEYYDNIPALEVKNGFIYDDNVAEGYICVEGKKLAVTVADDSTIAALAISDESPTEAQNFVNISWEDAQKLIGLPIS